MKYAKLILLYFSFCCFVDSAIAQSIIVDDSKNAQDLVENVLVKSTCATIANTVATGDNFSGNNKSYGYFNNQGGTFPFAEGVVLSTWSSQNSVGPFVVNSGGGNKSWLGDTDLELSLGLVNTVNATVLEFDFTPITDFLSFDYIFASNEYQKDYPCNYSDGFAFLIKEVGSTTPYKNIAVLPNSGVAVSSMNIHPKINPVAGSIEAIKSCLPENEQYFEGYNLNSNTLNYAGQTKVLNAQSSVIAGRTYHIKLVIADHRNVEFDSAVFLEAGSFAPKINLGLDRTVCFGDKTTIDSGLIDPAYTYQWFHNSGPRSISSNSTINATTAGKYTVIVTLAPGCTATGTININYKSPVLKTLVQCGDSAGNATFNLSQLASTFNSSTNDIVSFYETLSDLQNQTSQIPNEAAYNSTAKTIYARVSNATGCTDSISITLQVLSASTVQKITFCDNDANQNGRRVFNLFTDVSPKITPSVIAPLAVEGYYSNENDAINKTNSLPAIYSNNATSETVFARIENSFDCYGIIEIQLEVMLYTPATPSNIKNTIVNDFSGVDNSVLIETEGIGSFEYSLDGITFQSNPLFTNISAGIYTAYVRENLNCGLSSNPFYILDYPRFFTPNDDGFNDTWSIKNLDALPKATITIFNRFGKLLKQLSSSAAGWNGIFNGNPLPADDYWFKLQFENAEIINGHFSLKR
ncbi:gliding motility-associated-like protein [Flavobacterium sp. PL11]|uniref:T9SS type B sorting domain-containing protein n=1 Tax=Flavobacterium sp. PL11 TaxID=3071717 RepID=UPI002E09E09D|nr:gliding motility-associated-like protein [Flavobacterium sp. PL11]